MLKTEKYAFRVALFGGVILIIVGIIMTFRNEISGALELSRSGNYHNITVTGPGAIFIGVVILAFAALTHFSGGKIAEKHKRKK